MSPRFGGGKHDGEDASAAIGADIARLDGLPLAELAAEVMERGFGPGGPGGPGQPGTLEAPYQLTVERVSLSRIAQACSAAYSGKGVSAELQKRFAQLVADGLQVLEHAALVRVTWNGGTEDWVATRRGRAAAERGEVARIVGAGLA